MVTVTENILWHRSEVKHSSNTRAEGDNEAQLKLIRDREVITQRQLDRTLRRQAFKIKQEVQRHYTNRP